MCELRLPDDKLGNMIRLSARWQEPKIRLDGLPLLRYRLAQQQHHKVPRGRLGDVSKEHRVIGASGRVTRDAYLGLRDSWLLEDDALLDSIEALEAQADGTFYPTGHGPESCATIACTDLWGYLVPLSETEEFESLFLTHEDEQIAKLYAKRFVYARWHDGAEGKPEVGFFPAPVLNETPLPGSVCKKATWARFWSWGPGGEHHFDMHCDLVTGRCSAEIVSGNEALPAVHFRVAAAKIAPYVTIGEDVHYGEEKN